MFWLIVIVVVIIFIVKKVNSDDTNSPTSNTGRSDIVDKNYARNAIKFFDSYLSLCQKHEVLGICGVYYEDNEDGIVKTKLECVVTAINGEHGDEAFELIQRVWTMKRETVMNTGNYQDVVDAGDDYIKSYFGCDEIHWLFTEADEYQFQNGQAIITGESSLFTFYGAKWQETLRFIKTEIEKKWKNVTISIGQGGMTVENNGKIERVIYDN